MKQFFVYLPIPCQQIELLTYLTSTFYRKSARVIAVAQNVEEHSIGICRIRLLIKAPKMFHLDCIKI
jgi:hypothetical protein